MIELRGIERSYGRGDATVRALAGVDEVIEIGEHVAVVGPSGSGKSTLLNVIGFLDEPTAGSYRIDGREVAWLDEVERSRLRLHEIGFIFQSYHLISRLDALANVELPMTLAGVDPRDRTEQALEALHAAVPEADRAAFVPRGVALEDLDGALAAAGRLRHARQARQQRGVLRSARQPVLQARRILGGKIVGHRSHEVFPAGLGAGELAAQG